MLINSGLVEAFVHQWLRHNVPDTNVHERLAALTEEVGEVARCVTKMRPHVDRPFRGTKEEWTAKMYEELGDVFNTLIALCVEMGFDWAAVLDDGLTKLSGIDLVADPHQHGMEED